MESDQEYPLARGYRAASRLNLQHYIWKQSVGFLKHPKIPLGKEDGKKLRIADIGTGTGIWLLDLAGSLPPSAQLEGLDLDLSQCPPKEWLPENVKMRELNVYDDIPEDLVGVFDIINIRYFLCVVKDRDSMRVLQSLMRMLKPMGWIQWSEYDLRAIHVCTAAPGIESKHTQALMDFVTSPTPDWKIEDQFWVADLCETFKRAGLQEVEEDRRKRVPWTLPISQDVTLLLAEELGLTAVDGDIQEIVQQAARESEAGKKGVAINSVIVTVVGRKT